MLRVLLIFLVLIASLALGPILAGHQGYVLIQTDSYNIETSVTGLVISLILLFLALFAIISVLRRLLTTGKHTRGWFLGRKRNQARKQTSEALLKLAEGDYKQVEKLLTRNASHAEQPVVNYLLAAEAAQQRGDGQRTNQYLEHAAEAAGTQQLPVDITRARIQLAQGEIHAARHSIDQLLNQAPRHPEVLRLAEQIYLRTGAYNSLLDIIPSMHKIDLYNEDQLQTLQQQAYIGLMDQTMAEGGSEGLKQWWKDQSRKVKQQTSLQVALVEHLIKCDDYQAAQEILLNSLKHHYDDRLILLLPRLKSQDPQQIEKALQQQIKQHGQTPLLNSTLGQLCMQQGQWKNAATAFQEALKQRPDAHDYAWLADVLDKLHRNNEATQMRREGLILTLKQNGD